MRSSALHELHFREHAPTEGITVSFSEAPSLDSIVRPTATWIHNSPLEDEYRYHDYEGDEEEEEEEHQLPTWLSLPRSHLAEHNMERLGEAMRRSFFTQTEVLKLQQALHEASEGDAERISGAADFLLILVETMEMGYNALVAAAFHYSACVLARQRHEPTLLEHSLTDSFGEHVAGIIRDAARLKHLENGAVF